MFYLTTHATHFIYGQTYGKGPYTQTHIYIYIYIYRKEGNVLFNDTLNTFYLQLYGIGLMVKDHLDNERGMKEGRKGFI